MTLSRMSKYKRESPVEQLIELLLTDRTIRQEDMEEIRRWLVDENRMEEKSDVFIRKFAAKITYCKHPRESNRLWPEFARRISIGHECSYGKGSTMEYFPEAGETDANDGILNLNL